MSTPLAITAADLRVGDMFINGGGVVTYIDSYTLPGYNVDYVRTMDTKTSTGTHWPAATQLTVLRSDV